MSGRAGGRLGVPLRRFWPLKPRTAIVTLRIGANYLPGFGKG
jgi:hypothetical protein